MQCPGCTHEMTAELLDAVYGGMVEVDACHHCNGLWFDGRESLQLAPGATLHLFQTMYERKESARAALVPVKQCPRCSGALTQTFDMQRGTRFSYFRCQAHGRYTTFFHFLREKNLVRAPTPTQLAELKAHLKQIACSNCGGPIVLAESVTCTFCEAPVSILSEDTIAQTLRELQEKEAKRTTVDPTVAARLVMDQLQVARTMRELEAPLGQRMFSRLLLGSNPDIPGGDLVELGARALGGLLRGLLSR